MEDAVDSHETPTQGTLQLGTEQVSKKGRPHRARTKGTSRPINIPHDPTESQLHASVAELLDWVLKEPAFYTTFPAGWGRLSKGTAGRLFASGLKKGMPDILVFDKNQVVGIELKAGKNSVSAAQRTMFAKLAGVGITVYVCRSQDDVLTALYRERINCKPLHMSRSLDDRDNPKVPF